MILSKNIKTFTQNSLKNINANYFTNSMKIKFFFFVLFLMFNRIIFAQSEGQEICDCQLHGEVIDKANNQPIVGAVILLKGTKKGTTTDVKGHYHFDKLCHGSQTIICRIIGYKEITLL